MVGPGGKEGSEEGCQTACPELSSESSDHVPLAVRVSDEAHGVLQTLGTAQGRALTTFSLRSSFCSELGICSGLDQQQEQPLWLTLKDCTKVQRRMRMV